MSRSRVLLAVLLAGTVARAQETAAELIAAGEKLGGENTPAAREKAATLFERALASATSQGDRPLQARALYRLGVNAIFRQESRVAIEFFDRAIPLLRELKLRAEETRAHNNKASALWQLGEVAEALATYQTLLPIRRELKDRLGESLTVMGIGNCHLSMGEPGAALQHYREALALARQINDRNQTAELHNSIANALVQVGDFTGAVAELHAAAALWRETGNRPRLLYVENNLGWVHVGLRQWNAALPYLRNAERELAATSDRISLSYALHNLGSAYAGLGDLPQARQSFEKSLALKRDTGDRLGEAYTLQALGEITPAEAESYFEQALRLRRDIGDAQGLIVTLGALAKLHRDQQKHALARQEMSEAIDWIESRRAALVSQDLRATYFARKRDYYDFLIHLLIDQGDHAAALAAAERARGRQLLDRVSDTIGQVRQGVDPALLERERAVQRQLSSAVGRAAKGRIEALLRQARDTAEEIRRASPRYATLVAPEPLAAPAIQALLAPGETLLAYHVAEERSAVWLVTPQQIRYTRLPGRGALEWLLLRQREAITARQDHTPHTERLRRMLIPAGLATRRVIVAPDGVLESAPFSLLVAGEVALLPSATALALRRREKPVAPARVDILADAIFSPQDTRLPANATPAPQNIQPRLRFSRAEAESIAALAPQRRLALDAQANRAFLESAQQAGILHLATHSLLNSQYPELSSLVVSQYDAQGRATDGLVRLSEIFNLSLRARLVTLSACRSAGGANLPGEGLMSLTRGFLYAGAGAVLASLWDVDDRATGELMRRFYRAYLQQKLPLPAALRAAQQSLRAEPGWEHPYYWAGFVLQGEWR